MPKKVLNKDRIDFILKNRLKMASGDISKELGISKDVVRRYLVDNNLQVPKEVWIKFRSDKRKKPFTKEEDDFIHENIESKNQKWIAKELGRSINYVQKRMRELGYSDLLKEKSEISIFKKGNKSWNKGTKGLTSANSTSFKKGNKPHNTKEDGAISIRKDTSGCSYKYIRISESNWELLQFVNWRKVHGEIPKGYILIFKDGDSINCEVSNLELISREENMKRSSIHNYPEELIPVVRLIGKLNKKIKEL